MTLCPNKHFYDPTRGACPTCQKMGMGGGVPPGATKPAAPPPPPSGAGAAPSPGPTRPAGGRPGAPRAGYSSPANQVTQPVWKKQSGTDPVVGWLVAWKGKTIGTDYRLRTGRMSIGRGDDQDVQLDDTSVSRQNHAYIVFDPMNTQFFLERGDGRELVYLSKKDQKPVMVSAMVQLERGDVIQLGATQLVFVPFCLPGSFTWDPAEGRGPEPDAAKPEEPKERGGFAGGFTEPWDEQ